MADMLPPSQHFAQELRERGRRYGWTGDYVEIEEFIREIWREAGLSEEGVNFAPLDEPKLAWWEREAAKP